MENKAALVISKLEALAVLVALKLHFGETPGEGRNRVNIAPTITDNRVNGAALNKLMTTKFPASALLMELSCCMKKMSCRVGLIPGLRVRDGERGMSEDTWETRV